jgi:tetratricopeptide (TPR) repeat protein
LKDYFDAYINLAECYKKLDQLEESLKVLFLCEKINKDDVELNYSIGSIYLIKKEYQLAEDRFNFCIKKKTENNKMHSVYEIYKNQKKNFSRKFLIRLILSIILHLQYLATNIVKLPYLSKELKKIERIYHYIKRVMS